MKEENLVSEFHAISPAENFEEIKSILTALPVSENKVVIYDDLMTDISKESTEIFTNLGHHRNITNLFISQVLFMKNENLRLMTKNCHYHFFCRHQNKGQYYTWARQSEPIAAKMICKIFEDALSQPFSHLLYDSHPRNTNVQQMIRFRQYNFSNPEVITVYHTKC